MHPLRKNLIDVVNLDQMRDLYRSYNPLEKKIIWKDKMEQVILLSTWNSTQRQLIQDLKDRIESGSFDENNANFESLKAQLENWGQSALLSFSKVQIYNIVGVPHDFTNSEAPVGAGSGSDCECNKGSAVSCVFNFAGDCDKTLCNTIGGCGFMWLWNCNGECNGATTIIVAPN